MYSRITGYYRPVKNWNEGKTQEYKNRTTYDVAHSVLRKNPEASERVKEAVKQSKLENGFENTGENGQEQAVYLFTTKTCPNCKMAKEFLRNVPYQTVDAEENPDITMKFGVMQAPTLVVVKDGKIEKFVNASNIRKFAETRE